MFHHQETSLHPSDTTAPVRFIIDTWQYFLHRAMHTNTYLYKKFHSWHHRLYVPYAFGALYNHPVEGFLLDTCGAGLAEWIVHMSTREATLLFVVSTLKTVDDHCGYRLPWDPLQMFSPNNADYHDIHHQVRPITFYDIFGHTFKHHSSSDLTGNWDQVQLLPTVLHSLGRDSWHPDDTERHRAPPGEAAEAEVTVDYRVCCTDTLSLR